MRYFSLESLGSVEDDFALLESEPEELGLKAHKASVGKPIAADWPADARMQLPEENPGVRLTSVLGNTFSYLIVDQKLKDVIIQHCPDVAMEVLPVTILDHRGRMYSKDYVVLNPIGSIDMADTTASDIRYSGDKVAGIVKLVLDPKKLAGAPALFRLAQDRAMIIVNERLADAIRGFSNVVLQEIPVSAPKG
jgi:hypothetical protein